MSLSEKERAYEELDRVKRKCYRLRQEIRNLHAAFDESEISALRLEADAYKRALSNIAHRLETGDIDTPTLRSIVLTGLSGTVRRGRGSARRFQRKAVG